MKIQEHLGDGAYFTFDNGQCYITANHHEPEMATDCVYLDIYALPTLRILLNKVLEPSNAPQAN